MMKILILLLISITKEKLTFPFSIGNLTGTFYNKHIDNNISTNVYIGDPIIKFPLSIKLRQYPLLLADVMSNIRKDIPRYDPVKSRTYDEYWGERDIYNEEYFVSGFRVYDYFYFGNENVSNKFNFILVREAKKHFSGILGLSLYKNDQISKFNLIGQLKNYNFTKNKTFYFNFEDNKLIFDDYPHITYGDKYKEINFRSVKSYIDNQAQNFDIMFDVITYKKYVEKDKVIELTVESDLFKGSSEFGKYLFNNYFSKYKDCEKTVVLDKYYSFVCNSEKAMKNFDDIDFLLKEEEMVFYLSKNELFKEEDGKYYFLMYFDEKEDNKWSFGKNFFSKYILVFDVDKKQIGFYFEKKKTNTLLYILLVSFIVIAIVLGGFLYYHIINKPRRKRANELEDNYDYITQNDEKGEGVQKLL